MNIYSVIKNLRKKNEGSMIVEMAIIGPILVLMTIGILEFILAFTSYIQVNEAMRAAAREAFLQDTVADIDNLETLDAVCQKDVGDTLDCGSYAVNSEAAFNAIVAKAVSVYPKLTENNIIVTYSPSGVGSSSTTDGTVPTVSVEVRDYSYQFIATNLMPISGVEFPSFKTTRMRPY